MAIQICMQHYFEEYLEIISFAGVLLTIVPVCCYTFPKHYFQGGIETLRQQKSYPVTLMLLVEKTIQCSHIIGMRNVTILMRESTERCDSFMKKA